MGQGLNKKGGEKSPPFVFKESWIFIIRRCGSHAII
jgi:hypothetical protein